MNNRLTWMSAGEIAALVKSGEASAREVVDAHLQRIAEINPRQKAIIFPMYDDARRAADAVDDRRRKGEPLGPLAGVPITIKDSFAITGTPTTLGIGRRSKTLASVNAPLVDALIDAGAVIVGKTNVPQLMLNFETENLAFGRTPHPEREDRGAGGSSGGCAAAVASHMVPISLGGDLLGSIRQPAHVCGVHGYKSTMNRLTNVGGFNALAGMEGIISQGGPLARTMDDVETCMRLFAAAGTNDPYVIPMPWGDPAQVDLSKLRVGVWDDDPLFTPSPGVSRAVREAAETLRSLGAEVFDFRPQQSERGWRLCVSLVSASGAERSRTLLAGEKAIPLVQRTLTVWNMQRTARAVLASALETIGQPWRAKMLRSARGTTVNAYWELVRDRREYVRETIGQMQKERVDVILAPPHGLPAMLRGTSTDLLPAAVYSFVPNLLGLPAGTVAATRIRADEECIRPASKELVAHLARRNEQQSAGLPVGVQVCAQLWRDDVCLAVMRALENHFSTKNDYPLRRPETA